MNLANIVSLLIFIAIILIIIEFIYNYINYKKENRKLIDINKELINNYKKLTKEYSNVLNLLKEEEIVNKYKNMFEQEKRRNKVLEDYIKNISTKKRNPN